MKIVRFLSRESHTVQRLVWSPDVFCFFTASYGRNDTLYQRIEIDPLRIERWSVSLHAFSFVQPLAFLDVKRTFAPGSPPSEKGVSWMLHVLCSMIYSEGSILFMKCFFLNRGLASFLGISKFSVEN